MQPAWKILAPIDLGVDSEASVEHAIDVTAAMSADLTLLYVANRNSSKQARRITWPTNLLGGSRKYLKVRRVVLPGSDTPESIIRYADSVNARLLLMTSESLGRGARFWRRSLTADVMAATRTPVWVTDLRSVGLDYRFRCRRILCALQLDGTDDAVINQAEALAQQCGGELILLGTVPEISEGLLQEVLQSRNRPLCRNRALEQIQELAKGLSVPYEASAMIGSPYACTRMAVRDHKVDLVVAARAVPKRIAPYCLDMRSIRRQISCPLLSVAIGSPAIHFHGETMEATQTHEDVLALHG